MVTDEPGKDEDLVGSPAISSPVDIDLARTALARARARARSATRDVPPNRARRMGGSRVGEERRSGPGPDDRDPLALGSAVERLLIERGWTGQAAIGGVVGRWAEIVGPDMAAHVVPESFDPGAGVLVLRADSTAWATQVNFLLGTLRQRLAAEVGSTTVTTVRVVGPTAPSWRFGNRHVSGRGPRDTYG